MYITNIKYLIHANIQVPVLRGSKNSKTNAIKMMLTTSPLYKAVAATRLAPTKSCCPTTVKRILAQQELSPMVGMWSDEHANFAETTWSLNNRPDSSQILSFSVLCSMISNSGRRN